MMSEAIFMHGFNFTTKILQLLMTTLLLQNAASSACRSASMQIYCFSTFFYSNLKKGSLMELE